MAVCGPRGIPYSHWLGGPPEWDEVSRAAAVAWAEREADRCPGCGLHRSEIPDDLRDFPVVGEYRHCPGCEKKDLTPDKPEGEDGKYKQFRWVTAALRGRGASRRQR